MQFVLFYQISLYLLSNGVKVRTELYSAISIISFKDFIVCLDVWDVLYVVFCMIFGWF